MSYCLEPQSISQYGTQDFSQTLSNHQNADTEYRPAKVMIDLAYSSETAEASPLGRKQESSASDIYTLSENRRYIMEQLDDLINEDEDMRPSPDALKLAKGVINGLFFWFSGTCPKGIVSVGENHEIYLYWRKPGLSIQLVIPNSSATSMSIYRYSPPRNLLVKQATIADLIREVQDFASGPN